MKFPDPIPGPTPIPPEPDNELVTEALGRGNELRQSIGLFTEADMRVMLGVSNHTLQHWRVHGNGPKFAKLGKGVYYRQIDVQEWINNNLRVCTFTGEANAA